MLRWRVHLASDVRTERLQGISRMKKSRPTKLILFPDLFDWDTELERRPVSSQLRWVVKHCRVSLSTAATLAVNAGLQKRESCE
jgi:hypothetical protein